MSRSLVIDGDPLGVDQDQAEDRQSDRDQAQGRTKRVFHFLTEVEKEPHAQDKEQHVAPLDDQGLGPVGACHELAPEDRVGPGMAIRFGSRPLPAVGAPGDMEARGRTRLAIGTRTARGCCRDGDVRAWDGRRPRHLIGRSPPSWRDPLRQLLPPIPRQLQTVSSTASTSPSSRSSRGSFRPGFHLRSMNVPNATSAAAKVSRTLM